MILLCFLATLFHACDENNDESAVIASIGGHSLTVDDYIFKTGQHPDSTSAVFKNEFIDKWIKNQLILERGDNDKDIKKEVKNLVNDYRETLIIQKQKEKWLNQNLDTLVTDEQILLSYDAIKEEFSAKNKIVKAELVIVGTEVVEGIDLIQFFQSKKWDEWNRTLDLHPNLKLIDSTEWNNWLYVQQYIPRNLITESDVKSNSNYSGEYSGKTFFLKVYDLVDKNEIPPLSYLKQDIKRSLLHKRKLEQIKKYEDDLYLKALRSNQINIE